MNDPLREALEKIANDRIDERSTWGGAAEWMREIAREALADTPPAEAGVWICPNSGESYTAEYLARLLENRDVFLVNKGLFSEFVEQCGTAAVIGLGAPARPGSAEGWQDISTAPKDGTLVILRSSKNCVALGRWEPGGTSWTDRHGNMDGEVDRLSVTGVWMSEGGWFQPNEVIQWAPLPPTSGKGEG